MADEIQKLKKNIVSNNVLVFVGPDISIYTTNAEQNISHWKHQLKHQQVRRNGKDFRDDMNQSNNTTTEVVGYSSTSDQINHYSNEIGVEETANLMITIGQLFPQNPELIKAIGELQCPIITTNYDLLLEDLLNKVSLTWNEHSSDGSFKNMKDYILHLYGHYQKPDSLVFNNKDFDELYENKFFQSRFRTFIQGKTLLFIGYETDLSNLNLSCLLKWIFHITIDDNPPTIYKLIRSNIHRSLLENLKEIPYGNTFDDLISFLRNLLSFSTLIRENILSINRRENVLKKYLNYLINEYDHITLFGYENEDILLKLENIYVELKFDPTHPSIKAMKTIDINEEFKEKVLSYGFFNENEKKKLIRSIIQQNSFYSETIYRDLMIDQWLNILLSNTRIFSNDESISIRNKISQLKQNIFEKNHFKEIKQYEIQEAFNEFKHFIILGHPGSGKTTISKWLIINMAKQCLGKENLLFNEKNSSKNKIPILIPIWKYFDQIKNNNSKQFKLSLLEFLYENVTLNSNYFTQEENKDLSLLIMESLLNGNVFIIFEGLDEVPIYIDRNDLIKEINLLLEHGIDYDSKSKKLIYSIYEKKEINNTKDLINGNRFVITSRIEGNYFEEINFFIPRLTIEDMSNESLRLFCNSYTKCIKKEFIIDQLYNNISKNKDIFQLAINPQLASVIVSIYNQANEKLPEKRIDLYEIAIEKMIQRIISSSNNENLYLNSIILWSILQEIADYLHYKVEGLSENNLKEIIGKYYLINYKKEDLNNIDELILKLVDIFKYKVGLLNEFGHDSFRFIHRTFQEYLAAKNIIYLNGIERSENIIYENIQLKINIPNWRVPLNMTFGILSKFYQNNQLFYRILRKLLINEQILSLSTLIVPFVIIDSLNDMYFSSKETEQEMIEKLSDLLLFDYKNLLGFSKLKEHQTLIHSYFLKLQNKSSLTMIKWFNEKFHETNENISPCSNIIYQLKWFSPKFHEIFLKNLHSDSQIWNWPIDSILRYYSTNIKDQSILTQLQFKKILLDNPHLIIHISKNMNWLCLIISLYGGYQNYDTPKTILEYAELAQFLSLSDNERIPFIFYFRDTWDRNDTAYSMAVYLNGFKAKDNWTKIPIFDVNEIYKDSFLTTRIIELVRENRDTRELIAELREQISNEQLCINIRTEASIALIVLGDFDSIQRQDKVLRTNVENRIEELISVLKDPIARYSSHIQNYLLQLYNHMKINQSKYHLNYSNYCRIYLSFIANSGGIPVDTKLLAETVDNMDDKCDLYAEYFVSKMTGNSSGDLRYDVAVLCDICIKTLKSDLIIKSFLKINNTIQIYKPIRSCSWSTDQFPFESFEEDDIPIAFLNCLENIHTNIAFVIDIICDIFINEEYFIRNSELIPIFILFIFGIMSKELNKTDIYSKLLPELNEIVNVKEFLLNKIQSMSNPYYKSRAFYQLAQFYDEKSDELLNESNNLTDNIVDGSLRFQVLEKIYNVAHYKDVKENDFIQHILDKLISTLDQIEKIDDQIIASIRLSFYGCEEFRKKYLRNALEILNEMDENNEKLKLIIKLKPLISIYDDLCEKLDEIVFNLENNEYRYFVNSYYGKILCAKQLNDISDNIELQSLFRLFAQLNDAKIILNKNDNLDQLWLNLYKDTNNQLNIEKILKIGINNELFLTSQVAIIIDELIKQGKEERISIIFPYLIKPSNEVLPIVQRWFIDYPNRQIMKLSALLLVETKHIFELVVETLINLLNNDNDQLRYRAQRIFQHPERDPSEPSKTISVIGEKALLKILQGIVMKEHLLKVRVYLRTFFFDVLWDDPLVLKNLCRSIAQSNDVENFHLNRIKFISNHTWNALIQSLQSPSYSLYRENFFESTMRLVERSQIQEQDWIEFQRIFSNIDTNSFVEKLYFIQTDIEIIRSIINEIWSLSNVTDETYFDILQSKIISLSTIEVKNILLENYLSVQNIGRCTFFTSTFNLNQTVLNTLNDLSINVVNIENLIKWLIQNILRSNNWNSRMVSLMIADCLLSLVSACVQKENYLYRKITNASNFNKEQFTKILIEILNHHPCFGARGNAFILLAAMDLSDHKIIINALNTLFDENFVKELATIGIPLIHLSPNEFIDDLLNSLNNDSAIKVYELLKIITQFALDEKIDANCKSNIINYIAKEIGEFKSKRLVNYYYTDIKIPFTTTLENEFYKTWIKIQGLSGKSQYSMTTNE